jgi:hypothetical protein
MSIAHYTVPIPPSAFICPSWPSLCEETASKWGHCMVDKKYGGYVIEDKGTIVLVCTDELCAVLEEKDAEASKITFHLPTAPGISTANYTVAIPDTARVVTTFPSLEAAALQRPHNPIVKKYGGAVIEVDGKIVIACDEELSDAVVSHPGSLDYIYEDVAELKRSKGGRRGVSAL